MPNRSAQFFVVNDGGSQGHDLDVGNSLFFYQDLSGHFAGLNTQIIVADGQACVADSAAIASVDRNVLLGADGADNGVVGGNGVVGRNVNSLAFVSHRSCDGLQLGGFGEGVGLDDNALRLKQFLNSLVLDQGVDSLVQYRTPTRSPATRPRVSIIIRACSAKGTHPKYRTHWQEYRRRKYRRNR